jgi:hypothetical protein
MMTSGEEERRLVSLFFFVNLFLDETHRNGQVGGVNRGLQIKGVHLSTLIFKQLSLFLSFSHSLFRVRVCSIYHQLHLPDLGSWMNDMWHKRIQWFRLKINKTSIFLIKKNETCASILFSSSLVSHNSSSHYRT